MRLIDILSGPWAIRPEMLEEIWNLYSLHLRGDKIDLEQLRAETGLALNNQHKPYQVSDGVALLALDGVIAKRMNLFTRICGGVSTDLVGRDLAAALADREVSAIVMAIDSPGGTVDGTPELAEQVFRARSVKPVLAHSDGMICSAAYWIGAAAERVAISSDVVMAGSIGVVAKHVDISEAEAKRGVKTTEICAGTYKRIASQYEPLSAAGRQNIQEVVDHVYAVFVDAVGSYRGAEPGVVLERMADGRVFHGRQAIEAGLVDGVATLAETMDEARALARTRNQRRAGVATASRTTTKEQIMDLTAFREENADAVAQIEAEAREGLATADQVAEQIEAARAEGRKEGAAAELARVAGVRQQLIPGHEALIEQLAMDGQSTGADAAQAIVAAEKAQRTAQLELQQGEANRPVPPAENQDGAGPQKIKRAEFDKLSQDERRAAVKAGAVIVD